MVQDDCFRDSLLGGLDEAAERIFECSQRHGFWDEGREKRNKGEMIALMHSELSEALEGIRHGNPPSEKTPGFSQVEEELADCVIRILDMAYAMEYNLGNAILAKMAYNETRPFKHNKAF